jgi:hypothetical protein
MCPKLCPFIYRLHAYQETPTTGRKEKEIIFTSDYFLTKEKAYLLTYLLIYLLTYLLTLTSTALTLLGVHKSPVPVRLIFYIFVN